MEKLYVIYLHRNKINGKCYIGQTCQKPEDRWGLNGQNYGQNQSAFYRAICKYGWDNFEHIILETNIPEDIVDDREIYWGGYYHSLAPEGYNLVLGQNKTKIFSTENVQTRTQASLENWQNPQYRQKVIDGRKKMWELADEQTKKKMLNNLDRTGKGGQARSKKVECIETGIIYDSTRDAERQTGIQHSSISLVCTGKRQTAGKLHWRYCD